MRLAYAASTFRSRLRTPVSFIDDPYHGLVIYIFRLRQKAPSRDGSKGSWLDDDGHLTPYLVNCKHEDVTGCKFRFTQVSATDAIHYAQKVNAVL